jgi:outer membrane protein
MGRPGMTVMPAVNPHEPLAANWMIFNTLRIGNSHQTLSRRSARRLGLALLLASAAPAGAETLMDAVTAAYSGNPTLVGQRYRQQSTNETYVQARGAYGPTISIGASAQYSSTKLPNVSTWFDSNAGTVGVNVRQSVFSGGRQRGSLAQARANVLSSEEVLRRTEGEVVEAVIQVYASVLRDRQRVEVTKENVTALREELNARRAKRRVRDVTITDVAQSDSRLALGEVQLANAVAQLAISEGDYLRIVGHAAEDLKPLPELPGLPATIDEAFAIADGENANLNAARHTEEATRATIAAERGNKRPTASISASATKSGQLHPFDRDEYRTDLSATLTITQPIFQAGIISSRIRQAKALNNVAQAAVDAERRLALQDVVVAWNQLAGSRTGVTSGRRQVEAAQIAYAGMQAEERNGLRSTIELLNAEQELASAQLNLLSARYAEYAARAALLLAMGRLDARTVNSAIPAVDPDAEFKRVRYRGVSPTELPAMLLDRIGSASPYAKPDKDLTGKGQPKPAGSQPMPQAPDSDYLQAPLTPISRSKLITSDKLPSMVGDYGAPPPRDEDQ